MTGVARARTWTSMRGKEDEAEYASSDLPEMDRTTSDATPLREAIEWVLNR